MALNWSKEKVVDITLLRESYRRRLGSELVATLSYLERVMNHFRKCKKQTMNDSNKS